jgi:hypothetical protein
LQAAINETRVRVWRAQPAEFLDEAVIDADGTLVETTGECKEGMDIAYNGLWGYHPLLVSLANTREPLYLINRSGNRPSAEGAAERLARTYSPTLYLAIKAFSASVILHCPERLKLTPL